VVGSDPILSLRLPNFRQIPSLKETTDNSLLIKQHPKTQNSFTFHRQSQDIATFRQLWTEYALRKCPSISISATDTRKEFIDLDSTEVIDLDSPNLQPPQSVAAKGAEVEAAAVSWSTLESSINHLMLELHQWSLASLLNRKKSSSPHSLLSAQSQIVEWLKHWKSRSESLDVTRSRGKKRQRFQRNSKSFLLSGDGDDDNEFEYCDDGDGGDDGEGGDGHGSENETNLVILSGRCGISKSSLVHAAALCCGYSIIEVNSSHDRSGQNIKKLVAEAGQSQTLKTQDQGLSSNEGFNLILFDEVSGLSPFTLSLSSLP
jgi:hypothetical protein